MIEYDTCEINPNHFIKILKCSSGKQPQSKKAVIVIIPGNPGVIEFYEQFARDLNSLTNYDILGISHTGHLFDPHIKHWPPADVQTQVNDKVKFIQNYFTSTGNNDTTTVPAEIYFIGHSFGCYVILEILELLNRDVKSRVKQAYMLFPMVEKMATTPNGKFLNFATKYFLSLIYFFAFLITFLPGLIQRFLVGWLFEKRHPKGHDMHENLREVVAGMGSKFSCVRSCFHLGKKELVQVVNLNTHSLNKNYELLTFYYGTSDKWVPIEFHYDMKYHIADLYERDGKHDRLCSVKLDECDPPLEHAFVIFKKQTVTVANKIATWIAELN